MKIAKYILALGLAATALFACKKQEESTTLSDSFEGKLVILTPTFVEAGDVLQITPGGVSPLTDDVDFGYFWTVSPVATQRDTVRHIGDPAEKDGTLTFAVPDTLCSLTFTCSAFAKGYYNKSGSAHTTIVSDESLTDNEIAITDGGIFKDDRDGNEYIYNHIGGQDWLCSNLVYGEDGMAYEDCDAVRDMFGVFYTWEEASTACPAGWHLPTLDEWKSLCGGSFAGKAGSLMVDARFNGEKLWEYWPEVKITNETLFTALPAGYGTRDLVGSTFTGFGSYAAFWTADVYDAEQAVYVYLNERTPDVMAASADKTHFMAPVRCVR